MTAAGPPEGFIKYLKAQDAKRRDEAEKMFGKLTEREQLLVKEAATMGWVRGVMAAGGTKENIPLVADLLQVVLHACRDHSDLYPTIAALDGN